VGDPVIAIAVAALIVRVAYQILGRTVPVLVDERPSRNGPFARRRRAWTV